MGHYKSVVFGGVHDGRRVRIPVGSIGVYLLPGKKRAPEPYYGEHGFWLPLQRAPGDGAAHRIVKILAIPIGGFSKEPSVEVLDLLFAARFWLGIEDLLGFHDLAPAPGSLSRALNFASQISRPVLSVIPSA